MRILLHSLQSVSGPKTILNETYPVQVDVDGAVRFNNGSFPPQGDDFAKDADCLAYKSLEVFGVDTGSSFRRHGRGRSEKNRMIVVDR